MENYSVSKISPGNCLRMKHQTLERTKNYRSQHRRILEKSLVFPFLWEETLLRSGSDKFTSAASQTPCLAFHGVLYNFCISCSVMDVVVLSLLLPRALLPAGVFCSHVGLLLRSSSQRPSFVLISAPDTRLGMSPPTLKHQPHEVLQTQTSQTTPAFNSSPEFHKMLPAALEFQVNCTDI